MDVPVISSHAVNFNSQSGAPAQPLQPGEVITITLETPSNPAMNRNQYKFEHANGTIKATLLPKL